MSERTQTRSRRSSAAESSISQTAKRAALAAGDYLLIIGSVAFTLFAYLSLITFDAADPWFMQQVIQASGSPEIQNAGGLVGAQLAGALIGLLGVGAWLMPLVAARAVYHRVRSGRVRSAIPQRLALSAWTVTTSALVALLRRGSGGALGSYELAGGWLGQAVGERVFWNLFHGGAWVFVPALWLGLFVLIGGTPALGWSGKRAVDAAKLGQIGLNHLRTRFNRWRRERTHQKQLAAEAAERARLEVAGVGAELPADMPAYTPAEPAKGKKAKPPATPTTKSEDTLPAFAGDAGAKTIPLPTTVPATARPAQPFDSLSMTVAPAAAPAARAPTTANTTPAFTVVRKRAEDEPKPARQQQITMPLHAGETYTLPSTNLLDEHKIEKRAPSDEIFQAQGKILAAKLRDFGVAGDVMKAHEGPVITVYEFRPAPGTRVNKLTQLEEDLALAMAAPSIRISRFPNRDVMGIEIPNQHREIVSLKEIIEADAFQKRGHALPFALGKNVFGESAATDLSKMPHLLMGGATGSGKSVGINTLLISLLFKLRPDELKLFMIDPKMLELSKYKDIPHMGYPVVTDARQAVGMLRKLVQVMEQRYKLMMEAGVRNITGYQKKQTKGELDASIFPPMPYMVCIVDELADLMMQVRRDIEEPIARLAQMARAAGIHLVLATQRPSVDVVTGLIKSNFPARIAFKVSARVDSKTILDEIGAQNLLGKGDMLFLDPSNGQIGRIHGCFVDDEEVDRVCNFWREQGKPEPLFSSQDLDKLAEAPAPGEGAAEGGGEVGGDLYEQAVAIAMREQEISISRLQRVLGIGYNRAANLIDKMESEGVLGPNEPGGKKRKVLMTSHRLSAPDATPGEMP